MPKAEKSAVQLQDIRIRDIRSLPFYWIQRALFDRKPSWKALLAYNALAYHSFNPSGSSTVSLPKLATTVSISVSSIQRGLAELQQKRVIRVKEHVAKGAGKHGQLSNEYTLIDLAPLGRS
jgi:hypothetical protein